MALDIKGVVVRGGGGDEALCLPLGLKALHFARASSDRKVRVFKPAVVAQSTWLVLMLAAKNLHGRSVRCKTIGDDLLG